MAGQIHIGENDQSLPDTKYDTAQSYRAESRSFSDASLETRSNEETCWTSALGTSVHRSSIAVAQRHEKKRSQVRRSGEREACNELNFPLALREKLVEDPLAPLITRVADVSLEKIAIFSTIERGRPSPRRGRSRGTSFSLAQMAAFLSRVSRRPNFHSRTRVDAHASAPRCRATARPSVNVERARGGSMTKNGPREKQS